MTTPHWTECKAQILEQIRLPSRVLVALDFDGTLAPIVTQPVDAALPPETLAILQRMAGTPGITLAIISGRAIRDVAARVPVPGVVFSGNHGLETEGLGLDGQSPQARRLSGGLDAITADLRVCFAGLEGLHIEHKQLSLSIHYRQVPEQWHPTVVSQIDSLMHSSAEFRVQQGRRVVEIVPALPSNKGTAILRLLSRLRLPQRACFFAGDDTTDEHAFTALPNAATVCVGVHDTSARWRADSPANLAELLSLLRR